MKTSNRDAILAAAKKFLSEGIFPIAVHPSTKQPIGNNWQHQRHTIDDLDEVFSNGAQIGILLGVGVPSSDGSSPTSVADIDADCLQSLPLMKLLPPPKTERIYGHKSKPRSHLLYRLPMNSFKGKKFLDTSVNTSGKHDCFIELRGSGQQSITPPSIHVSGEPITWDAEGEFGVASCEELIEYVSLIAAACLLVRHWPSSPRHEARWALLGALLRNDWPEEKALDFVRAVITVAQPGESPAVEKIDGDLERFKELRENGGNTIGLPRLAELVGDDVVKAVTKWLGLKRSATTGPVAFGNMILTDSGVVKPLLANAITKIQAADEWQGVLAFDEFSLRTVARKSPPWPKPPATSWTDTDDIKLAEWLQHNGVLVGKETAADAAQAIAAANPFHPVKEYLDGLQWDGTPRLDAWLTTYLGAEETDFTKAVGARWMVSAVARIFEPGCKADCTLLLEGPQGLLKSTALRVLASDAWFTDHLSDLDNKDSRIELHGVWIIELGELANMRHSQVNQIKTFLSSTSDYFRMPYGRRPQHIPRTNVFAGSVNDDTPLTDETGNRRFWPVRCGKINVEDLKSDRDQLWAEAVARYKKGEKWWLDTEELNRLASEEQKERYEPGVWDQIILAWLEKPTRRTYWIDNPNYDPANFDPANSNPAKITIPVEPFDSTADEVTITDVLLHAVGKEIKHLTHADRNQVSRCLTHAGWTLDRKYVGLRRLRFYKRPEPA